MADTKMREEKETPAIIYDLDAKVYHGLLSVTDALESAYSAGRSAGLERTKSDELYAAWQAWLIQHGVPISEEFARLAEAVGEFTVEQRAAARKNDGL
jgi:hypothetical protein